MKFCTYCYQCLKELHALEEIISCFLMLFFIFTYLVNFIKPNRKQFQHHS